MLTSPPWNNASWTQWFFAFIREITTMTRFIYVSKKYPNWSCLKVENLSSSVFCSSIIPTSGQWRSNYYCCYDYDKNWLFVFLFDPKLATIHIIWNHPLCLPHWLLIFFEGVNMWTERDNNNCNSNSTVKLCYVMLCYVIFILFVWKGWLLVVESFPDLIMLNNLG